MAKKKAAAKPSRSDVSCADADGVEVPPKAKAKKKKAATREANGFEESLWDSANRLRGSVDTSEYKHVVLGLILLKFVSDKLEERYAELITDGQENYTDMVEFYTMHNVFYLPKATRWSHIRQHAKQDDIAKKIDSALTEVEKGNASLKGALPDNCFSRLGLVVSNLLALKMFMFVKFELI